MFDKLLEILPPNKVMACVILDHVGQLLLAAQLIIRLSLLLALLFSLTSHHCQKSKAAQPPPNVFSIQWFQTNFIIYLVTLDTLKQHHRPHHTTHALFGYFLYIGASSVHFTPSFRPVTPDQHDGPDSWSVLQITETEKRNKFLFFLFTKDKGD